MFFPHLKAGTQCFLSQLNAHTLGPSPLRKFGTSISIEVTSMLQSRDKKKIATIITAFNLMGT
jgi:hypothetical protein